jgi:hypothetical protein
MSLAFPVGREGSLNYFVKLFLPASAAATGGGGGGGPHSVMGEYSIIQEDRRVPKKRVRRKRITLEVLDFHIGLRRNRLRCLISKNQN